MKITSLQIKNFLGVRAVDVTLKDPVTMFVGPNGSGKSSLQEAVRMALIAESVRVPLKKDYAAQMLTTGKTAGSVKIVCDGSAAYGFTLPKVEIWMGLENDAAPYVLDAHKFSSLSTDERRSFLFDLMGLKTDHETVRGLLLKDGHAPQDIEDVMPLLLRAGFDAAMKEAQGRARECKGAWKAITHQAYGSVKAASWQMEKSEVDIAALEQATAKARDVEAEIESETLRLGDLQSRARNAESQRIKRLDLINKAYRYAALSDKLSKDESELKEWQEKADAIRPQTEGAPPGVKPLMCPACGRLSRLQDGKLVFHVHQPEMVDPAAREKLAQYEEAGQLMERCVANDKRDLAIADAAARMLEEIGEEEDNESLQIEIGRVSEKVTVLKASRNQAQTIIRALEEAKRNASNADQWTKNAHNLHLSIQAWEALADSLSPAGIPGKMLDQALGPINERLAYSAHDAGWAVACIGSEMGIFASMKGGLRPYEMLSESEKWRVDAMIAEAISHISGLKFVMLDRFDCLDTQGREDLIYWLDGLASKDAIDMALIFGTLKSKPDAANLPETVEAFWIENGVIMQGEGK